MKLVTFSQGGSTRLGVRQSGGIIDITRHRPQLATLRTALELGALREIEVLEQTHEPDFAMEEIRIEPVVPDPKKIICVGLNYQAHRDEAHRTEAEHPTLFTRFPDSQTADGAVVTRPKSVSGLDYEGELAVVIGAAGSSIRKEDASSFVAGYACYNDFSARDWQAHSTQWTAGKNFPGTGAFGPCLVTVDEIPDATRLTVQTRVNGELRQSGQLSDLIFPIPNLIAYISQFTLLSPGDVIVTGTPAGVGAFADPPVFLQDGDDVEVAIPRVGTLRNRIRAEH